MPIPDFMIKQTNSKIVVKQSTKYMRLKQIQLPGGHKEGRASFPAKKLLTRLKNSSLEPYLEKEEHGEGEEHRETERRKKRWRLARCSFCPAHASQGRAPALLWPPGHAPHSQLPPSLSSPPSLPLMTQLPLSAEIKLQGP